MESDPNAHKYILHINPSHSIIYNSENLEKPKYATQISKQIVLSK